MRARVYTAHVQVQHYTHVRNQRKLVAASIDL